MPNDRSVHRSAGLSADELVRLLEAGEQVAQTGSWEWLPESGQLTWSANLYRLMGVEPGEITPSSDFVLQHTHPHDRQRVQDRLRTVPGGMDPPPFEYRIRHRRLGLRFLRSTVTSFERGAEGAGRIVGVVQDVTDQRIANREVAAHIGLISVLSEWDRVETSAQQLLRALGEACECALGVLWVPHGNALAARAVWSAPGLRAGDFSTATFSLSLEKGTGLPGRAWASMQPETLNDVANESSYLRREPARRARLRGALAIPAVSGNELLAVVELYSTDPRITEQVAPGLAAIGPALGIFLARRRGQLAPPVLTRRELEILRAAAAGRATAEAAKDLSITAGTAKSHLANIYRKLGVRDRAAAVALALRLGLID